LPLKRQNSFSAWEKIYHLGRDIQKREHLVAPLVPILKREGYAITVKLVKAAAIVNQAAAELASRHYNKAEGMMALAYRGDKGAARAAYNHYNSAKHYDGNYKDVYEKKAEAYELGIVKIQYCVINRANSFLPHAFVHELNRINTGQLNSKWEKYYVGENLADMDYHLQVNLENINIGPEVIRERSFEQSKEIKNGFALMYDRAGKVVLDSLGNEVRVPKFKTVNAHVFETTQEKVAIVNAKVDLIDARRGAILDSDRLCERIDFNNCWVDIEGDKRALTTKIVNHANNRPVQFPSDRQMLLDIAHQMKSKITNCITGFNI